jgi:hypothetical protein
MNRHEAILWLKQRKRAEPWHDWRYAVSIEYLTQAIEHKRVLDFGGESLFTELMRAAWPDAAVDTTGVDDVRTFHSEQFYDTVICTEVIEHVHDTPTIDLDARARWTGSGQIAMLHRIAYQLSPGGKAFITTPNACSLAVIYNAINQLAPRTYDPHVRELTLTELCMLVSKTGMHILDQGGWVVWDHHGVDWESLNMDSRPDDLYLLARKD